MLIMYSLTNHRSLCKKIIVELEHSKHWEAWPQLFLKIESGLVPDISVYKKGSLEADFFENKTMCEHIPKLIVEIISKDQPEEALKLKTEKFINAGVPAVWVFEPYKQIVFVFTQQIGEIESSGIIESEGICLDLAKIFN